MADAPNHVPQPGQVQQLWSVIIKRNLHAGTKFRNKKRKKKLINEKETIFFPLRKIKKNEV